MEWTRGGEGGRGWLTLALLAFLQNHGGRTSETDRQSDMVKVSKQVVPKLLQLREFRFRGEYPGGLLF